MTLLKQLVAVPVHLLIRGPEYPQIWLGRLPVLDIFVLVLCLLGIAFYGRNYTASRTWLLAGFIVISAILVALGGPVELSLLVPIMYALAATGLAYLLQRWLRVFPRNPLGRTVGVTLLTLAVACSCVYNLRAYYVAWPHNTTTKTTFHYHIH